MFKLSGNNLRIGILASSTALAMPSLAFGAMPRVVVIGGGAGGTLLRPDTLRRTQRVRLT